MEFDAHQLRNSAELLCSCAGHGVGRLRHDNRRLLHRQPRRLPRPRQAADLPHRHQRPEGEFFMQLIIMIYE